MERFSIRVSLDNPLEDLYYTPVVKSGNLERLRPLVAKRHVDDHRCGFPSLVRAEDWWTPTGKKALELGIADVDGVLLLPTTEPVFLEDIDLLLSVSIASSAAGFAEVQMCLKERCKVGQRAKFIPNGCLGIQIAAWGRGKWGRRNRVRLERSRMIGSWIGGDRRRRG